MATPPTPMNEPSIIEIIQNMVKEGESEEAILQTLNQLGVDPKKAQRLLLLAQADTFSLLRSEISKIVKQDIDSEKSSMQSFVRSEAQNAIKDTQQRMSEDMKKELRSYETDFSGKDKNFQSQITDTITKFTDLSERMRQRVNELSKDVQQLKADQDEIKLKGLSARNRTISLVMLAIGLLFVLADLALFVINFGAALTIDSVVIFIVIALIGITMMFLSTFV